MLTKKVARVALILGLVLSCRSSSALAVPTLSLVPSTPVVQPGQRFALDVEITNVTDLFGFQFDLAFNPSVLSATSIMEGSFLPRGGTTVFLPGTIDNVSGTLAITADSLIGPQPGVHGSGTLATLDFQALALGTSPVTLSNVILLDSSLTDMPATLVNGAVTVVPEPATGLLLATGCLGLLGYGWRRRPRVA